MKITKRLAVTACLMLASTLATGQQQEFETEFETIRALVAEERMSVPEGNREILRAAKTYFPNDPLLINYWEALVEYGNQMEEKKITPERYKELVKMRAERFDNAVEERRQQYQAQQRAQQEEYERLQRAHRNASILQSIGDALKRRR